MEETEKDKVREEEKRKIRHPERRRSMNHKSQALHARFAGS